MSSSIASRLRKGDHTVLLYSDDAATRDKLRLAVGRDPSPGAGSIDFVDASTVKEVIAAADARNVDLLILDGEAWPSGGMGISRQLKNEIDPCPPICLLVARQADQWLASWSQADAIISLPLHPIETARTVVRLLVPGSIEATSSKPTGVITAELT